MDPSVGDCGFMSIGKTLKPFDLRLQWNIRAWQVALSPSLLPVGQFMPGIVMAKRVGYEEVLFGGVLTSSDVLVRERLRTVRCKRPLDRPQAGHRKRRQRTALHPVIADGVASDSGSEHSQIDDEDIPCPDGSPPQGGDAEPEPEEEYLYSPTSPGGGNSEGEGDIIESSDGAGPHADVTDDGDDSSTYWEDRFADPAAAVHDGTEPAVVAQYTEEELTNQFGMDYSDLVPDEALADGEGNDGEPQPPPGGDGEESDEADGNDGELQPPENNEEEEEEEELLLGSEQDEEEVAEEAQDREQFQQHDDVPGMPLPPPVRQRKGWIYTPYFCSGWLCFPEAHPHQRLDAHCTNSDHGPRCHWDRTMIGRSDRTRHLYGRSAALSAAWLELSEDCKTRGEHQALKKELSSRETWEFRCSIRDKMMAAGHSGLQYILEEVERQPSGDEEGGEPRSHYYRGD